MQTYMYMYCLALLVFLKVKLTVFLKERGTLLPWGWGSGGCFWALDSVIHTCPDLPTTLFLWFHQVGRFIRVQEISAGFNQHHPEFPSLVEGVGHFQGNPLQLITWGFRFDDMLQSCSEYEMKFCYKYHCCKDLFGPSCK